MLLMDEKGIQGGLYHVVKQIINIWRILIKISNHHTSPI